MHKIWEYVRIPGAFAFLFDDIISDFFQVDDFLSSFLFIMISSFFQELGISYIIIVLEVDLLCGFDSEIIESKSSSFDGFIGTRGKFDVVGEVFREVLE